MIRTTLALSLLVGLAACPKNTPAPIETGFDRSTIPTPLEAPNWTVPAPVTATLSNGVTVALVENHELPLVDVRAVFTTGSWTDEPGKEGLAEATMDMLNEGAGELDAVGLSAELRKLATNLGTYGSLDTSSVTMSCVKKNLEPSLDLWATVLLKPTFPASDWERLTKNYLQNVEQDRTDPDAIAWRVSDRVLYGNAYDGRMWTEQSIGAIDTAAMKAWYDAHLVPANALILVGGDTTLDEMVPLLEARLAQWTGGEAAINPTVAVNQPQQTTLYVVDKPGAAQSVIITARFIGDELDPHYWPVIVGNMAWGGQFMARLNMNLREEKGYTYGARSRTSSSLGPVLWNASTSVRTDATVDSVSEIFRELADTQAERPLSSDEIDYFKSSMLLGYPSRFETSEYLLDRTQSVWRYDLPADWLSTYISAVQGVTQEQANNAFIDRVASQPLAIVVVGDMATVREGLEGLGKTVVELNVDGEPVQ